jgi:hypothetical protein
MKRSFVLMQGDEKVTVIWLVWFSNNYRRQISTTGCVLSNHVEFIGPEAAAIFGAGRESEFS